MSEITLVGQIEAIEAYLVNENHNSGAFRFALNNAILASLKRLQASEQQEPVAATHLGWDYRDDGTVVATYFLPVPKGTAPKLYALPLDAQAMIDKLTAERDALRKQLAQGEANNKKAIELVDAWQNNAKSYETNPAITKLVDEMAAEILNLTSSAPPSQASE